MKRRMRKAAEIARKAIRDHVNKGMQTIDKIRRDRRKAKLLRKRAELGKSSKNGIKRRTVRAKQNSGRNIKGEMTSHSSSPE